MCPFCLYNKKHDNVAVWQKDFGTFCFSVNSSRQSCSLFWKMGIEIKMLSSLLYDLQFVWNLKSPDGQWSLEINHDVHAER